MSPSESRWTERWAQIKSYFDRHEIISRGGRWWCCRQPDTGSLGFDVYVDHWGGILVDGDFEGLRFAYSNAPPIGRVHWIGSARTGCPGITRYEMEKASIGTGHDAVWTYNADAAVVDLREIAEECDEELAEEPDGPGGAEILALAEEAGDLTQEQMMTELMEIDPDAWELDVGIIPTDRVLYAHAAIARLSELLKKESA